jgi:hypothetical protein
MPSSPAHARQRAEVERLGRAWAWAARELGTDDPTRVVQQIRNLAVQVAEARRAAPNHGALRPVGALEALGLTGREPREALEELDRREALADLLPGTVALHDRARQELLEVLADAEAWHAPVSLPDPEDPPAEDPEASEGISPSQTAQVEAAPEPAVSFDGVDPDMPGPRPEFPLKDRPDTPDPRGRTGPVASCSEERTGRRDTPPRAGRPRRSLRRRVARRALDLTRRLVR